MYCADRFLRSSQVEEIDEYLRFELFYDLLHLVSFVFIAASPAQKWGAFGHFMATFDKNAHCTRCCEKSEGSDLCVNKEDCLHCDTLTTEQKLHLSMPSCQRKKEKDEQKSDNKSDKPEGVEEDESSTLVGPSLISVIGVAKDSKKSQKLLEKAGINVKGKKKHSSPVKSTKSSTDSKLEAIDHKWSERFRRLEALLISKSLQKPSQELTFQTVKMPTKIPPASALKSTEPFLAPIQPAN